MKKAILFVVLLLCSLCSCSFSAMNSSNAANEKSEIASLEESEEFDSSLETKNFTEAILHDEVQTLDQICYSDNQEYIYILSSENNQSRLLSLNPTSGDVREILVTGKTVRMAIHSDTAFLLQEQQVVAHNLLTGEEAVYELPKDIPPAKSYVLPETLELAYSNNGSVCILPLSEPEKRQSVQPPDGYSISSIRPLGQELLCNATDKDNSKKVTFIMDQNGSVKSQWTIGNNDPVLWQAGALLTQGIEGQNGTLYFLDAPDNAMWQLPVSDRAEANAATISNNGQWIMTVIAQEGSSEMKLRLYNLADKTVSAHIISDDHFAGTLNFVGGGNSLLISDDGSTAGIYFLGEKGFQFITVNIPCQNESVTTFDLVAISDEK